MGMKPRKKPNQDLSPSVWLSCDADDGQLTLHRSKPTFHDGSVWQSRREENVCDGIYKVLDIPKLERGEAVRLDVKVVAKLRATVEEVPIGSA